MARISFLTLIVSLVWLAPVSGQTLPLIDDVSWDSFRQDCRALLAGLDELGASLPPPTARAVRTLLAEKSPRDARASLRAVQKLLDEHCLVGVHVNPESRVKAVRGDRKAELTLGKSALVLVKVHNEAGVTPPLGVASEQASGEDRWVTLGMVNDRPFANKLTGHRVEYRVMKLTARQTGKREATLAYDVGQGSQDLGFRAEVPILFTVRPR